MARGAIVNIKRPAIIKRPAVKKRAAMSLRSVTNSAVKKRPEMKVKRIAGDIDAIRDEALSFDWDDGDLRDLGWLMSTLGLDLATAVRVFLNAGPERFNYLHREEVPLQHTARVAALDCLHMKISYGFYLPHPDFGLASVRADAQQWIDRQRSDAARGVRGRWHFDEDRFEAISDDSPRPIIMTPKIGQKPALWRSLFEPIWKRG
ncbi:hypothetical protein [Thalassovita aquimarina]|uniref:DUF4274 domain-containing protein n=1 Tax=Thalassovita aquimarina TaxID=2785917 RepID=A0ABS5HRM1_9RHOB|nr:hypothetical protein [Thalassovita aquimarina]MBR9651634.1 hypothetical protein [Thalassovita aquimarina]